MYEQVYQFNARPFTAAPYVKHYFAGDAIHTALGQTRVCIDRASGPVVVIGGTGSGKSLLLAMLEEQYQSQFDVVNLACARLDNRRELLQSILFELQLPFKAEQESDLRFELMDFLSPSERCPNGILLLVDEAHSLSTDLLDELRLIMNFVRDGQPRVRLVMAGSNRLEENLTEPKLDSFNQRIAARCYLQNMSRDETANYVTEHIDRVGGSGTELFDADSLKAIHEVSDGCPRLINQVCDQALIVAATHGLQVVTGDCVHDAWADVQCIPGARKASSNQTQQESVAALESDEKWTVIEFGQLEDESPEGEVFHAQSDQTEQSEPNETTSAIEHSEPNESDIIEFKTDFSQSDSSDNCESQTSDSERTDNDVVEIVGDFEPTYSNESTDSTDLTDMESTEEMSSASKESQSEKVTHANDDDDEEETFVGWKAGSAVEDEVNSLIDIGLSEQTSSNEDQPSTDSEMAYELESTTAYELETEYSVESETTNQLESTETTSDMGCGTGGGFRRHRNGPDLRRICNEFRIN